MGISSSTSRTNFSSNTGARPSISLEEANAEIGEELAKKVGEAAKNTVAAYIREKNEQLLSYKKSYEDQLQRKYEQLEERNRKTERDYNSLKQEHERLKSEIASEQKQLKDLKEQLEREKKELHDQKEEVLGLTGLGLKGRKMRGDVAPGDITHGDIAIKYKEYFKQYLRSFPRDNPNIDRSKPQSYVAKVYQEVYAATADLVLDKLQEILKELLQDPATRQVNDDDIKTKERHHDIATAYSLLLYHSQLKGSAELLQEFTAKIAPALKVTYEKEGVVINEEFLQDTVALSVDMLALTPPQIVSMPEAEFDNNLHEKHYSTWKTEEGPYDLVYLRPVLFNGRHGAVAVPGQVGNTPKPVVNNDTSNTPNVTATEGPGCGRNEVEVKAETDSLQCEPAVSTHPLQDLAKGQDIDQSLQLDETKPQQQGTNEQPSAGSMGSETQSPKATEQESSNIDASHDCVGSGNGNDSNNSPCQNANGDTISSTNRQDNNETNLNKSEESGTAVDSIEYPSLSDENEN